MLHRSLRDAVLDLERHGHLRRIEAPMDPDLVMPLVQRRVYAAGGPALLFERVEGSPFPAVSNLFGTLERARFLFRDTLERVRQAIAMRADPASVLRAPWRYAAAPVTGLRALPREVGHGPVLAASTTLGELPQIRAWPEDGGPFITLPQVYTEDPEHPGFMASNLGMYRVQLAGNEYAPGREVGLHYQIHRGIGVHHAAALARGEDLRVSVFVGGPPAHTLAAVMPLPEGMTELLFAGMLAGRRVRLHRRNGHVISVDADFCLVGRVRPDRTLPEGPFGDHLGYYSLRHPFPVLEVEHIYCRRDAIWPFTVVGRPPQEDTTFGALIHELTGPMVPASLPGVHALHAVDAAGVHPLLLAVGSERYVPYGPREPRELLTVASAILGFGQASLAKVLLLAAAEDDPPPATDVAAFLQHVLARFDPRRDLHFHTRTTMDTLDYSGPALNRGSKLVLAAAGPARRELGRKVPPELPLPAGFCDPRLALPGVLVLRGPPHDGTPAARAATEELARALAHTPALADVAAGAGPSLPLVIVTDDSEFAARTLDNLLWVTFTRIDPAPDLTGVGAAIHDKHWGCTGAVVLDARSKPHHAPPLVDDPATARKVDALAARGGPLAGLW